MKQLKLLLSAILIVGSYQSSLAQSEPITLKIADGELEGTLLLPENKTNIPVVLFISGSGPTDRDGNQGEMKNNSLKLVAEELQKQGYASLRFDKRGVGQSTNVDKDEYTMRFETFVNDAKAWVDLLSKDQRFSKIVIAGHSEGSMIGMLASVKNKKVSGFISIAGAGRAIDVVLKEQLENVQIDVRKTMYSYIDKLKKGDTLGDVPPIYYALFRPSIQPYMASWMKYDPQKEIKKLNIPILIIQGTTDIQVKEADAIALKEAQPKAKLKLIKDMNHVLKDCTAIEKKEQLKTYDDPNLPLSKELMEEIGGFMDAISKN